MFGISFCGSNSFACVSSVTYVPWYIGGKNAEFHSGGPTVVGTSGHNTTKLGRFLFCVPSPYVIHDPIDGRPATFAPVFIMIIAGSCFGISVYTDRTTQMSSMHSPIYGKISLTSIPLLPYFL